MGVFQVFKIVQMLPDQAKHKIFSKSKAVESFCMARRL